MFKNSHLTRKKRRTALVIGCGRLGANLAGSLCDKGYDTIVIDKDETAFGQLPDNFSGYQITGDGTDKNLLELSLIHISPGPGDFYSHVPDACRCPWNRCF